MCSLDDKDMASVNTPTVASTVPSEFSVSHNFSTLDNENANSMNENSTQFEILKLLRTLQAMITNMNTIKSSSMAYKPKKKSGNTPDKQTFPRRVTNMYCWTHDGCAHAGSTCNDKAPGNKNDATFENKEDGF